MAQPVIQVRNLRKEFDKVVAVSNLNFVLEYGETIGLLGGNGAGKSTTLSMLLGLLLPSSGEITILGHNMLKNRHRVLPLMNFSSPYVDLPYRLTVRENLTVYGHLYGLSNPQDRIVEVSHDFDLCEFLDRPLGKLSAGQKTRAALAKALLNKPKLLLLDEPTASMDPDTAEVIRQHLMSYQASTGATIILASHNMAEVERLCQRVLIMKKGEIVEKGSPAHLLAQYDRQNMEEVFLDVTRNTNFKNQRTEAK